MARLVTLLPEPDSPTMPSVRPRSSANDSPSTALTRPSSVGKWIRRSRTSRNAVGRRGADASTGMSPIGHDSLTLGSTTA